MREIASLLRQRRWAWGVVLSAAGLALAMLATHATLLRRAAQAGTSLRGLQQQEHAMGQAHDALQVDGRPSLLRRFVSNASGDPEALLKRTQRSAVTAGVTLALISSANVPGTQQTVGHTELVLAFNGSYANVKGLLAETLDRSPSPVLRRFALRRLNSPTELQAQAGLWLVLPPLPSPDAMGEGH